MLVRMWNDRNSHSLWVGMQNGAATWKTVWQFFFIKLNMLVPYDPAIALLGIYPMELKTYVHTENCTWMFLVTSFIIVENWNHA